MLKQLTCACALGAALSNAGCATTGSLTLAASSDVTAALAVGCPVLAAVKAVNPTLSTAQQAAATALALACPPNAPPTSALVAVADLISAYTTLQPLLRK